MLLNRDPRLSTDLMGADRVPCLCAFSRLPELLTRPSTLHILWSLSENGSMRFGALRKSVTRISARVLTERLRTLEAEDSCFVTTSQRFLWL
jgi:DNA-binding HxlR family transcriptional regulator